MDSKSISRKGVGVRLPSLAPRGSHAPEPGTSALAEIARELTGTLWPSLGRGLRGTREELAALLQELRAGGNDVLDDSHIALQEELAARTRLAGWCLGVLAAARGVDLLRSRHETDGLRWMVGAVASARNYELVPRVEELPSLAVRTSNAWKVSLLAAWSALHSGMRSDRRVHWKAGESGALRWLAFEARAARTSARRASALTDWPRIVATDGELRLEWL